MINKKNSSFYLRYLAKVTDSSQISYDQIPKSYWGYQFEESIQIIGDIALKMPNEYFNYHECEAIVIPPSPTFSLPPPSDQDGGAYALESQMSTDEGNQPIWGASMDNNDISANVDTFK